MSNMTFPGVNPIQFGPAHSNGPHNAKKALYVIISAEIPENLVHKSYCLTVIFDEAVIFFLLLAKWSQGHV